MKDMYISTVVMMHMRLSEVTDTKNLLPQKVADPNCCSFRTENIHKIPQLIQAGYSFLPHQKQQKETWRDCLLLYTLASVLLLLYIHK